MAQYSGLERKVAKILESQPWLRDVIRYSYKRLVFILSRESYTLKLKENISLIDVAELCGVKNYDAFYFGYYDKSPWNKEGEFYISQKLEDGVCSIVLCNLKKKNHEVIGASTAWNFQQGAMAQWMGERKKIIYNDYEANILGARILNLKEDTSALFVPYPVQVVHPKGEEYLSINYRRLAVLRPDYGYFQECSNFTSNQPYDTDGIWRVSVATGQAELIISLSDLISGVDSEFKDAQHKVNHCYYSPSGKKFVFLHRWLCRKGKYSRLICYDRECEVFKTILDHRMISHYSWIDEEELIVWARTPEYGDSYIILNSETGEYQKVDQGSLTRYGDGHPTIDNTGRKIVTDTYPDKGRIRTLLLYDRQNNKETELGKFFSPWKFEAEKRCDLHPRWHPTKPIISFDSAHGGKRKNYIMHL